MSNMQVCCNHPHQPATWRCIACNTPHCQPCLVVKAMSGTLFRTCCRCGGEVESLVEKPQVRPRSFYSQIPGAFAYPLIGTDLLMTIFGAVFFWLSCKAASFGLFLMLASIPCFGYLYAYGIKIINRTADGEDRMPSWPTSLQHLVGTFFMVALTMLLAFLPVVLYIVACFKWGLPVKPLLVFVYAGLFLLPMALLRVALFDTMQALSFGSILRSIRQAPTAYMAAFLVLLVLFFANTGISTALKTVPLVGGMVAAVVTFYLALVEARILGLLYRTYQHRYDWFAGIA